MNASINQINQQIGYLDARHLEELQLFVEFLLIKQRQAKVYSKQKQKRLLTDIEPIDIPVGDYTIQRDEIYDSRI